eukprot:TRINITY_DN2336_c0_g1_i1.p1 TRINITY_DN2336_c0_g1~~TRINITY_DN2336_c0_g1_i1.p1  ORF type:complete len:669 (+),score=264.17 TRINITY_DN2336_c0_g1_i1:122-2008(+)
MEEAKGTQRTRLAINKPAFEQLLKERFFFTPSFEIYGGVAGLYDYGPPACAIKANFLHLWRQHFVLEESMLEIDCTCLTPEPVLKTSGHVDKFKDFMVKDAVANKCYRADHLLEETVEKLMEDKKTPEDKKAYYRRIKDDAGNYTQEELAEKFKEFAIKSPDGNDLSAPYSFNLMFENSIGPTGTIKGYLRPETAQGMFVNFGRLLESNGGKLPFAAAQIGLAFRNEIAPRSGLIRVREFCMAEIEHFLKPHEKSHPKFNSTAKIELNFLPQKQQKEGSGTIRMTIGEAVGKGIVNNETLGYFIGRTALFLWAVGIKTDGLRFRQHREDEMAHYAQDCWDAEILTSYGWVECVGIADRSAYDLTVHAKKTKSNLYAHETFATPQVVTVLEITPDKPTIGKLFKKEAQLVLYLEDLAQDECSAKEFKEQLAAGKATIKVEGKSFELLPSMVKLEEKQKKISGKSFVPGVIEPSFGVGRVIYSLLEHSFYIRPDSGDKRKVLGLSPIIAPVKCSILPLTGDDKLAPFIPKIASLLTHNGVSSKVDDSGMKIGKRYLRTDEVGIPFGITIDFDTLQDETVTLRDRDSTQQIRVKIEELPSLIKQLVDGKIPWSAAYDKFPKYESKDDKDDQ